MTSARYLISKMKPPIAAFAALLIALGPSSLAIAQSADDDDQPSATASNTGDPTDAICPYCGTTNCQMQHYETERGSVMVMDGIPSWLFGVSVAGVILFTFATTERMAPRLAPLERRRRRRKNLIQRRSLYHIVRSRYFQAVPQLMMALVLVFLIYAGLFGSQVANITPIAVWTLWWGGLIFAVLMLASSWCFICPWDGIANLVSRLRFAAKVPSISLELPFPSWLRSVYPAIALFTVLTWLELGYGVTTAPRATAIMGLAMIAMASISALLWREKKFCAHFCPVGRICGIYSNFAPIEIRANKIKACRTCTTEDCKNGSEDGYPCPTGISLKTVQDATHCTMCTECVKSCKRQNVALNLRPFGEDLRGQRTPTMDEAWLALMLLALTLFHGLSMTPTWESFAPGSMSILKWIGLTFGTSRTVSFTLAMVVAVAIPVGLYASSANVAARWAGGYVTAKQVFLHYSFSLLPVALFYHLAHNLMHVLMEGGSIVGLLSDPLGQGHDYFGTAAMHFDSMIGEDTLWIVQVALILVGHVFGVVVAHRLSRTLYDNPKSAMRSLLPMTLMMVLVSIAGLSLMHLDMNMRAGRM